MLGRIRSGLTYANVTATIALFVALGGGAYAAIKLPAHSVGTRQLKNKAVTPAKVAPNTIALFKGQTGPRGPQGIQGSTGPSNAYYGGGNGPTATVSVPAGDYALHGIGIFSNSSASNGQGSCALEVNGSELGTASLWAVHVPANGDGDHEDEGVAHLSAAGTISNSCSGETAGVSAGNSWILAMHVGAASP